MSAMMVVAILIVMCTYTQLQKKKKTESQLRIFLKIYYE